MEPKNGEDLQSFLRFVQQQCPREYVRVEAEVRPQWEMAGVVAKLETKMRVPVLEFAHVAGSRMPVVTNVCGSVSRVAKWLGISMADLEERMADAYDSPIPPQLWTASRLPPVREVVRRGDEVDLTSLPQVLHTDTQTAPYITAASVVARDPDSGTLNISFHRLMILGHRRTGIFMTPEGHLEQIFLKNATDGLSTPIAIFVGAHPLWSLGSLGAGGLDVDEFGIIGALLGHHLEVTRGLIDERLLVPARAELVLEGYIRHDEKAIEGPFGEAAGYVASEKERPVIDFHVLSSKSNPMFQDIASGHMEHLTMTGVALLAHLKRTLVRRHPGVLEIHIPAPMTIFVRVDKSRISSTEIRAILEEILLGQRFVKQVLVFDSDIQLRSLSSIQWAIGTSVQADKDILILQDLAGNGIDPSECNGRTTKWGIDATIKCGSEGYPAKNRIPQHVLDGIDLAALLGSA